MRAEWVGRLVGETLQKQASQRLLGRFDALVRETRQHQQTIEGWQDFGNPFWLGAQDRKKLIQRLEQVRTLTVELEQHIEKTGLLEEPVSFWTQQAWGRLERGKALLAEGYTPRVYQKFFATGEQQRSMRPLSVGLAATRSLQDLDMTIPDLRRGLLQIAGVANTLRNMKLYKHKLLWVQGKHRDDPEGETGEFDAQLRW